MGSGRRSGAGHDEYRRLRHRLVEHLLATGATHSVAVATALEALPRHEFLSPDLPAESAYDDEVSVLATDSAGLPTSTISQPSMVAKMLDQLAVRPGDRILEIGTASGYNTALLRRITGPAGAVVTVEVDAELADGARRTLDRLGVPATVLTGDGWAGAPGHEPFDRVIATVGVWDLSPAWFTQLRPGGTLVSPLWLRPGLELSVAFRRVDERLLSRSAVPCAFLRLRGDHAGPERYHRLDEDTAISGELLDGPGMDTVRRIWADPPHAERDLPRLPSHWFSRLALGHPGAVQLYSTAGRSRQHAAGFFDPDRGGLVVVRGGRLVGYGDPAITDWLSEALRTVTPLDPQRLRIDARRTGRNALVPPASWLLARPEFQYWITER